MAASAAAAAGEREVDLSSIVKDIGAGQLREPLRYCIAVDGSELSLRTFHAAAMLCCRGDHVTVLHIADPGKSELCQRGLAEQETPPWISREPVSCCTANALARLLAA